MRNRTYGGVRGRKTKVGRKLSFSSYSIFFLILKAYTSYASSCVSAFAVTYIWLRLVGFSGSVIFNTPAPSIGLI